MANRQKQFRFHQNSPDFSELSKNDDFQQACDFQNKKKRKNQKERPTSMFDFSNMLTCNGKRQKKGSIARPLTPTHMSARNNLMQRQADGDYVMIPKDKIVECKQMILMMNQQEELFQRLMHRRVKTGTDHEHFLKAGNQSPNSDDENQFVRRTASQQRKSCFCGQNG